MTDHLIKLLKPRILKKNRYILKMTAVEQNMKF